MCWSPQRNKNMKNYSIQSLNSDEISSTNRRYPRWRMVAVYTSLYSTNIAMDLPHYNRMFLLEIHRYVLQFCIFIENKISPVQQLYQKRKKIGFLFKSYTFVHFVRLFFIFYFMRKTAATFQRYNILSSFLLDSP